MKTAIVLGASGLIGGHVLSILLADNRFGKVICIGRRPLEIEHEKLEQLTGDLFEMESFKSAFQESTDLFVAIGTTRAKTPDKTLYEKIDLGIPVAAAKLSKTCGIKNIAVVSSMGADANSRVFYSSLKGKMEDAFLALSADNVNIVRPSLLLGDRNEDRAGESIGAFIMTKLDFLVPEKHKAIEGKTVAQAMVYLANQPHEKKIWLNNELKELARKSVL